MICKKLLSVLSIFFEPRAGTSETKAVAPFIHVPHDPFAADTVDIVGQQDLQIADGRFFQVIASRVLIQTLAALVIHANHMTGFMQKRMHRGVGADVHAVSDDARLGIAPEAACDQFLVALYDQLETKSCQKRFKDLPPDISNGQYAGQSEEICLRTIRTRSSTIACRSSSSSWALPSTSVES